MRQAIVLVLAALVMGLVGCAPTMKTNTINQFNAEYDRVKSQGYQIQPGDTLDITFFYTPEYNATSVPVRPDGKIQLSLVGDFPIAGMTPDPAAAELKKIYTRELKNPDLAVIVKTFGASAVVVQGEVRSPAQIPLIGNARLLQIISQAGGFLPTADIRNVTIVRHSTGGKPLVTVVNLQAALQGTNPSNDLGMLPGDVVFVRPLKMNNENRGGGMPVLTAPSAEPE
jgi:protein involved in polysaccharide export with SLBB domain